MIYKDQFGKSQIWRRHPLLILCSQQIIISTIMSHRFGWTRLGSRLRAPRLPRYKLVPAQFRRHFVTRFSFVTTHRWPSSTGFQRDFSYEIQIQTWSNLPQDETLPPPLHSPHTDHSRTREATGCQVKLLKKFFIWRFLRFKFDVD